MTPDKKIVWEYAAFPYPLPDAEDNAKTTRFQKHYFYWLKSQDPPDRQTIKASIEGKPEGFVKVVRETKYDQVLGVHIIGPRATDLIAEACVALQLESTAEEIYRTIHAHPTLSEAVAEAAHASSGHAIHF